ncbi:MAG: hypothetical protein CVT48_03420 [Thermoplasmata archaeon HGW-Thermoplasmata-1]|nr:MAG: hypothetical protein CVT48_03420 [Thermoplasmata archaeon HGW-Thermoplasmata-1]
MTATRKAGCDNYVHSVYDGDRLRCDLDHEIPKDREPCDDYGMTEEFKAWLAKALAEEISAQIRKLDFANIPHHAQECDAKESPRKGKNDKV